MSEKMNEKKLNTRVIRKFKSHLQERFLHMLTCYDYQTACLLNKTNLDLILVGDSLGNVVLGHETTIKVSMEEMTVFSSAVKRGAPDKFVVVDLPFGSYATIKEGIKNATEIFQRSGVEGIKLEGAYPYQLDLIKRLTEIGIPVMGHIGLKPQSVHEQGGYYIHGKDGDSEYKLVQEAAQLEKAGAFAIVIECVDQVVARRITENLNIPTIGIGSGDYVDGQVLVINDLLKMGPGPVPGFVKPVLDLYQMQKNAIQNYLSDRNPKWEKEDDIFQERNLQ